MWYLCQSLYYLWVLECRFYGSALQLFVLSHPCSHCRHSYTHTLCTSVSHPWMWHRCTQSVCVTVCTMWTWMWYRCTQCVCVTVCTMWTWMWHRCTQCVCNCVYNVNMDDLTQIAAMNYHSIYIPELTNNTNFDINRTVSRLNIRQ